MKILYCILFLILPNTIFSQICCDSLKKCMYYGKILVNNIEYRDSLLIVRAKTIDILQKRNDILLDSIKHKNIILSKQSELLLEKENIIFSQKNKIAKIKTKNIVLISVIVVLTLLKL